MLIVDAGGFARKITNANLKITYLLKGFSKIGYQAVNLAASDLDAAAEAIRKAGESGEITFVTANLYDKDGHKLPFARPWVVLTPFGEDGPKVGVFGVTEVPRNPLLAEKFKVADPAEAAREAVRKLRKKVDLIVGLAYMPEALVNKLAQDVPGVDLFIAGRSTYRIRGPHRAGPAYIAVNGNQGKYIGDIRYRWDANGKPRLEEGELVPLDSHVPEDPELKKLVDEYKAALRKHYRQQLKVKK